MRFIKKYFEKRNIAFYVALGAAALTLIVAIVYGATWTKDYESVGSLILLILGALAFVGLSYLDTKIGAAVMTACNVIALALFINAVYPFVFSKAISGLNLADPEIAAIIVNALLMIVATAAANVFVWLGTTAADAATKAEQYTKRAEAYEKRAAALTAKIETLKICAEEERAKAEKVLNGDVKGV